MKNKIVLNTLRSVSGTKSRFIAIMAIIAIGCGFFAGIKSAAPDMKLSAAQYYDEQGLADIHIMASLGFDDEDTEAVKSIGAADDIYAGYSADLFVSDGEANGKIVKAYSYDPDSKINLPCLTEGRLPEKSNEIVIDNHFLNSPTPNIGDIITLATGDDRELSDILSNNEFTVVGKAKSPVYVAHERGSTSIGNGTINGWVLIPEENFAYDIYTDIYLSVKKAKGLDPFSDSYEKCMEDTIDILENMADAQVEHRKNVILDEAYEEINDAKAELEDGKKELADAEKEIAENKQKLADAEKEIADGQEEIDNGEIEYNDGLRAIDSLNSAVEWLNGILTKYETNAAASMDTVNEEIGRYTSNDFFAVDDTLTQLLTGYMMMPAAYDDGTKAMAKQGIEQYINEIRTTAENTKSELETARTELDNAKTELEKAKSEVADGYAEIADGEAEIADAKAKISDGEAEIADAEAEAHEMIDDAEWYVFDRDYNPYYSHFSEDCDRVDAIAAVFPIFFILVAALVCCTTMTRMVEEQRTQIGTLKALGYSRFTIISQYILYAVAASVPGGFIGLLIGFNTLPRVIFVCYQSMYTLPYLIAPFKWDYAIGCVLTACLCTGVSALYASRQELVSCPAQLMRPKPPKDGKRILLERISFIWKRLKFTTKVTFRNLFRYKARLLMTVIGIAGCTALLLTAFGLKNSISVIVDKQYGQVFLYDAIIALDSEASDEEYAAASEDCDKTGIISEKMFVMQQNVDIMNSEETQKNVCIETYLLVPEKPDELYDFIDLHERKSKEKIKLGDGVVLAEKLAKLLDVKAGDNVYFVPDVPVKVSAICENYTFNYVYMTPDVYAKSGIEDELRSNMILANMNDISREDELSSALLKNDTVLAISYSSSGGNKFRELVDSLSLIVIAVIVAAGALAFVVLFNLSNINITERTRELATIKVLGFYDGEVAAYVYRENVISTILGTLSGLVLGIFLEKFVVQTAEVDAVMFSPDIPLYCFIAAAAMTMAFAVLVNITLYFKLKKIDMATSLKAIE